MNTNLVVGGNMPNRNCVVINVLVYGQIGRLINFGWLKYQNLKIKENSHVSQEEDIIHPLILAQLTDCVAEG